LEFVCSSDESLDLVLESARGEPIEVRLRPRGEEAAFFAATARATLSYRAPAELDAAD
jgi:hypothetical protein